MAMCDNWKRECSVVMGKAMAVRRGMNTTIEEGFKKIIVEVDNLKLFHALNNKKMEVSTYGYIL
ncbi:SWI/SNF-related matrix-associated actin-dependent regulator of chromatin subfamily A-like protein 1 [Bienertia sinuspersici]